MKTLNRWFGVLIGAFICMALGAYRSEAGTSVRSPQKVFTSGYTTVVSSVTGFSVVDSTTLVKPGAVYQLIMSTGTAGDYIVFFDTTNTTGLSNTSVTAAQMGPRIYFGSTTQSTVITFDPPMLFSNGLFVQMSTNTNQIGVLFEVGRGLSGE